MAEEKKEEKKEEIKEVKPQEVVQAAPEAQVPATTPDAAKPAEQKTEAKAEIKKEKPSNCAGCKKSIKKKRWYYRDGKFYCSKRCFKSTIKKDEKIEAPKA